MSETERPVIWVVEEERDRFVSRPGVWDAMGTGEMYLFRRQAVERAEALSARYPDGHFRVACYAREDPPA